MVYRNGTYVAFDGNGTTDPTQGDLKYYALLKSWNNSSNHQLNFSDSHLKPIKLWITVQNKHCKNVCWKE